MLFLRTQSNAFKFLHDVFFRKMSVLDEICFLMLKGLFLGDAGVSWTVDKKPCTRTPQFFTLWYDFISLSFLCSRLAHSILNGVWEHRYLTMSVIQNMYTVCTQIQITGSVGWFGLRSAVCVSQRSAYSWLVQHHPTE